MTDWSGIDDVDNGVQSIARATGRIDVLINNAGYGSYYSGLAEVDGGNFCSRHGEVVGNVPLSGTVAFRVAGSYDQFGPYIHNVAIVRVQIPARGAP